MKLISSYRIRENGKEAFGHRPASSIRPYEIADWLDSLGRTPATVNRYKVTLSSIYRYGRQRDKVQVNPAREVAQQRLSNGIIRYLKPEEEKRLRTVLQKAVDACGPQHEQRQKRLQHRIYELDVALGTGMRKGEQYGLCWSDIDFDRRVITLRDTKNGSSRTVPMIDDVLNAFKQLKKLSLERKDRARSTDPMPRRTTWCSGLRTTRSGGRLPSKRRRFRRSVGMILRHTFCSRLAQAGVSLKVIQEAAGHKTIQMTARYAHMDHTTLQNAMSVLNRSTAA